MRSSHMSSIVCLHVYFCGSRHFIRSTFLFLKLQLSIFFFFSHPQKHKRKNHCDDKSNDSSGNLADLSSNEDDVNVINGSFEKLQVDKAYEVKYSDVYGRLEFFDEFFRQY